MSTYRGTKRCRIARRARLYGYFRDGECVYVFCPLCRERVENSDGLHGGSVNARLDRAMLDHLEDCREAAA